MSIDPEFIEGQAPSIEGMTQELVRAQNAPEPYTKAVRELTLALNNATQEWLRKWRLEENREVAAVVAAVQGQNRPTHLQGGMSLSIEVRVGLISGSVLEEVRTWGEKKKF